MCTPPIGTGLFAALLAVLAPLSGSSPASFLGLDSAGASAYLSQEAFPGLHILERVGAGPKLLLYRRGQQPAAAGSKPLEADASRWGSWQEARQELQRLLRVPEPEPLQLPWALFDAQGRRIEDLATLRQNPLSFLLEIGQWMWPAVRVGFQQTAEGVHGGSPAVLRTLSLRPVVFEVRDFITQEEAEEVMRIGHTQGLHSSKGVLQSADIKKHTQHTQFRTSTQAWLQNDLSPVIAELDERVANLTRVPASHNEAVQLLRYNEGQYYHGHMDWTELELYPDQRHIWASSHFGHQDRMATVFWYLNDVEEGGETIFPKHGQPICSMDERGGPHTRQCKGARDPSMTSCKHGLKVPPRRGTVILWYNYHPSGRGDRNALHAGCPVGRNLTKWSANKWVRIKPTGTWAEWVEDHPAMKRHGWTGDEVKPTKPPSHPVCLVTFTNQAGVDAELTWYNPSTRSFTTLATVVADVTISQNSYHGHRFRLEAGQRHSNVVVCEQPGSAFVLTDAFQLRQPAAGEEL